MKLKQPTAPLLRLLTIVPLICVGYCFNPTLHATPYASGVTNDNGTVHFVLNEAADNVTVTLNSGSLTNDLGALAQGAHSFTLDTATNFQIRVSKASAAGFVRPTGATITSSAITNSAGVAVPHPHGTVLRTSQDTNVLVNFFGPRAVTVNRNPKSPYFGRIYIGNALPGTTTSNGVSRTVGDGIYMLNADQSDAIGQGNTELTGGLNMATTSASMPWKITIGQDDNLYICDWTDSTGNLYVTDPNVGDGSGQYVLPGPYLGYTTGTVNFPVTSSRFHGSIAAAIVEGSLAAGNLKAWVIDEDLQDNRDSNTSASQRNSLWQHDIGGSLPGAETVPTRRFTPSGQNGTPGTTTSAPVADLDRGLSGHFYYVCNRQTHDTSGLIVRTSTGGTVWNSRSTSTGLSGGANDFLFDTYAVAVSADQKYVAVARRDARTWIVPLTNNVPDLSKRLWLSTFPTQSGGGRAIRFDVAGNLYMVNNVSELLRVFSPGGTTLAVTTGDLSGTNSTFKLVTAPVIRSQPTNFTAYAGTTAAFSVFVEGLGTTPSYQWRLEGTNISGATLSSYTRANIQQTNAGNYSVVISNELAVVVSTNALLTVQDGLPVFTTQAASRTVDAGTNSTFTAATIGTDPRVYQWQLNGVDIPNATNVSFIRTNAQQETAGDYTLIVSNSFGAVTSIVATLTVTDIQPTFTTALANRTQNAGTTFTWTPVVRGTDPRTYQWLYNTVEIPDATNVTYAITNVQQVHAGDYTITVSNSLGTATSTATLIVTDTAPVVTTQPANLTVNEGTNATFSVATRGTDPRYYQWQRDGVDIPDATDTTYTLLSAQRTDNAATFAAVITNSFGSVTSTVRTLTVNYQPEITTQPQSQVVDAGTNVTFSVEAVGNSLKYQWLYNGGTIVGATATNFTKVNVQQIDAGTYSVVVTNTAGTVTSADAILTVGSVSVEPPVVAIVGSNGNVTLTWSAVEGTIYRVQYKNDLNETTWTDLSPDVTASGSSASKNDNLGENLDRYYRVIVP